MGIGERGSGGHPGGEEKESEQGKHPGGEGKGSEQGKRPGGEGKESEEGARLQSPQGGWRPARADPVLKGPKGGRPPEEASAALEKRPPARLARGSLGPGRGPGRFARATDSPPPGKKAAEEKAPAGTGERQPPPGVGPSGINLLSRAMTLLAPLPVAWPGLAHRAGVPARGNAAVRGRGEPPVPGC